jgi:hypothetical protein
VRASVQKKRPDQHFVRPVGTNMPENGEVLLFGPERI